MTALHNLRHLIITAIAIIGLIKSVESRPPTSSHNEIPHTSQGAVEPGAIKLFGRIVRPSQQSQRSTGIDPRMHNPANIASGSSNSAVTDLPLTATTTQIPRWILDNVKSEHWGKYLALIYRLKIQDKQKVRTRFLKNLKAEERKAIEEENVDKIQEIIDDRPHLVKHSPLEYPLHIRPKKFKVKALIEYRKKNTRVNKRIPWSTEHHPDEAEAIRQLTMQLHGDQTYRKELNKKITKVDATVRRKAVQGDEEAINALRPKDYNRRGKRKHAEVSPSTATAHSKKVKWPEHSLQAHL